MIDNSPVHTSQTSQADVDQLQYQESDTLRQGSHQQEDILEEKASLASHSTTSVASVKSKSSRVSVTSSKSSVHSRESVASSHSSKSSRTSIPSCQSSSSHSKVDSSELPAASDNSLTQIVSKDDGVGPETADADTQYNYEDDTFEEPEELVPEEVKEQPEAEQLEGTDPEPRKESDSDPSEVLTEDPTHQTEMQSNGTDTAVSEEDHLRHTKLDDDTDMGQSTEYEDDKFEETNPEETDGSKQPPEQRSEDTNPDTIKTPPSPSESVEGSKEMARETPASVEGSEEKEPRVESENADSSNTQIEDHQTRGDAEVKVPSRQSSSDGTTAKDMANPESVKEARDIEELPDASKAGSEEVKDDGVSEGQSKASGDTQEAQIESNDQADVSKEQLPQGILLSTSKRKSTGLSVSFEAASGSAEGGKQQQGARGEQQPTKDLSASSTIEEAKTILQKSQSTASLGSLLNEKESTPVGSELDLSGSEDEDIPDLEQKISDLIDGDNGDKTESQENAETGEGNEKERVGNIGSEDKVESLNLKAAMPQPVSRNEKVTLSAAGTEELQKGTEAATSEEGIDGAEEESEMQEGSEAATVPASEKETGGTEEKTKDARTADIQPENDNVEQPSEDKTPTSSSSLTNLAIENQDAKVENQGQDIPATNLPTDTAEEVAEPHDQEAVVNDQDIQPSDSQTETVKDAETNEKDANPEAKAGTSAEGEPELASRSASVLAESADINDAGSVKSGLSSSPSLTSVSSQGSRKS